MSDLEKITNEFNSAIEALDLPVRENIEFCQKKIKNREIEIEKYNEIKNSVIEAYPNSIGLDLTSAYKDIENLLCELSLSHECINVCEKNIFDEEEIEDTVEVTIEEETEEPVIEDEPKDIKDEMVFVDEEETQEEVVEEPTEEVAVEETAVETEEKIEEETPVVEEPVAEATIEEPVETAEEEVENEEIGSVSYVLSDGESLENIAEKVYPSRDNWEAIYYFNKETIDKYLVSNGISNDFDTMKELASDTSLFSGIKLEIPTDYNYKI